MRTWIPYILLAGLCASVAADESGQRPGADDAPEVEPRRPLQRTGDQITLKSGRVLHGVKIVRETPVQLVLEILPGIEPLIIPRKQVSAITYGALSPRYTLPEPHAEPGERAGALTAVKMSPELVRKLAAPMTDTPVRFDDQDVVNIIRTTGIMSGIPVSISGAVEERPLTKRRTSLTLEAGATMNTFLRGPLAEEAPWLDVRFAFDRIYFEARERSPAAIGPGGKKDTEPGGAATGFPLKLSD